MLLIRKGWFWGRMKFVELGLDAVKFFGIMLRVIYGRFIGYK